jgi:hypothetical protein
MKNLGMILIVVGLLMTIITGFNFVTKKKVVDFGSVEINKEEKTPVYWSPVLGGILLVGGIVITLANRRKS